MSQATLKQRIEEARRSSIQSPGDRNKFLDSIIAIIDTMYDEFFNSATDIPSGAITGTQLATPKISVIPETVAYGSFTDNGDTTGYIDLSTDIPAGGIPLGCKFDVTTGFTGDTSATVQCGVDGDLDRFTEATDQSVFATAVVAAIPPSDACDGVGAVSTPRVTVTSGADFSNVSAGAMTVYIYYIETV